MTPLRIAIVGTGAHMREHLLPTLRALPGVQIAAVASRDGTHAAELVTELGAGRSYAGWESALESGVDGVVVAGPPSLHAAVARAALEARVPIYIEKPPAPDLAVLDDLIAAEERSGGLAFVGYNFRFARLVVKMRASIAAPRYLRLRFVTAKPLAPLWDLPSVDASYLYAVAVHPLEAAINLFGSIRAVTGGLCPLGGARFAAYAAIAFNSGAAALLDLGNCGSRFDCHWQLVGHGGAVAVVDDFERLHCNGGGDAITIEDRDAGRGYGEALAAFAECIRERRPSPSPLSASRPVYEAIQMLLDCWRGRD